MKKIKGFNIDIRPLKDPTSIPIDMVGPNAVQFRPDGILLNKLYLWETLLSVKISPIFCEHDGEQKNGICLECGEEV